MGTILDGKKVSEKRLELLKERSKSQGLYPRLATVIVGNDPASQMYVRMKHRACEQVGIASVGFELPADASTQCVTDTIARAQRRSGYRWHSRAAPPAQTDQHGTRDCVGTDH